MATFSDVLMTVLDRRVGFSVLGRDDSRTIEELTQALVGASGDVTGRTTGQLILERYAGLDDAGKR
ncbi:MAG: decarboxylase, partial [Pseudomonadota bacterium]